MSLVLVHTASLPLTWGQHQEVRVGVWDADARRAYTHGQCHALAMALARRFGLDVYQIGPEGEGFYHLVASDGHIALDAEGERLLVEVCDEWAEDWSEDMLALPTDEAEIDALVHTGDLVTPDHAVAEVFAATWTAG